MKKGDVLLIIAAMIFLALWLFPASEGSFVTISVDGELYEKVSLDTDNKIDIESKWGKNTVVIERGEVYVTHADCPDKLCQKHRIKKTGRSIVCLPNRLSVMIEGNKSEEKIDVIV